MRTKLATDRNRHRLCMVHKAIIVVAKSADLANYSSAKARTILARAFQSRVNVRFRSGNGGAMRLPDGKSYNRPSPERIQ